MAVKIEKKFFIEKFFAQLPQILADVRYASSTSYLLRMGWFSLRRLFISLSWIFPSEEKICIHPTEPDLRLKIYLLFILQIHKMSANLANVLATRQKTSDFWNKIYLQYFIHNLHTFSHCIRDFHECSHNSLMGKGIYDFWVFMAYHHLT